MVVLCYHCNIPRILNYLYKNTIIYKTDLKMGATKFVDLQEFFLNGGGALLCGPVVFLEQKLGQNYFC